MKMIPAVGRKKCVHICVKHIKGNNGIKIKCRPSKPVEEERRKVK